MIIVTNTIKIEPGYGEHVISQFTQGDVSQRIADVEGFLGFELFHNQAKDEFEEVVVTSRWTTDEAQKNWVKSTHFKEAHGRTKDTRHQKEQRKGIISSSISRYDVVHEQLPVR
ncbi:antibiotic biosynthesis monooxygenase [Brochothrix campestris]|uniref:antibiotic biosynthesis monooxygenase n=1 Tax=Brochothrix campestris TaxID=2757 RepID=UPI0038D0916E